MFNWSRSQGLSTSSDSLSQHPSSTNISPGAQADKSRASKRITARLLSAAVAAIVILMSSAPSASAWNGAPRYAKGTTAFYCIHEDFTTTRANTIRAAFEAIDDAASALTLTESWYYGAYCDVRVSYNTAVAIMGFNYVSGADINVNPNKTFWWYEYLNSCVNVSWDQCSPYAYSAMLHEAMHWLGFEHPGTLGSCAPGYKSGETLYACDTYGERVMYMNAADGYYRWLRGLGSSDTSDDGDDLRGINAWYDW